MSEEEYWDMVIAEIRGHLKDAAGQLEDEDE